MRSIIFVLFLFFSYSLAAQVNHAVSAAGMTWSPSSLTIDVGDTVTWDNSTGTHNVNGTITTFPNNPEGFGNTVGTSWTYQHKFTIAGTYDYQCDVHFGSGMAGTITVQGGGAGFEAISSESIELYPNPFSDELIVNTCNGCQINLYSLIGKLELEEAITGNNHRLITYDLPEGIYLYEIINNHKKIKSGKLVKH